VRVQARQEFQRAKMEGELEREIRREREKRLEVLRKELEAKEHERRSQAEEVRALALFKTLNS
jgi:hypothetical protein